MLSIIDNKVDARELQQSLGNKRMFGNWIRDCIQNAELVEGVDFLTKMLIGKRGGRPSSDYLLTIDAAKNICLMSNTQKGRELRRYLISLSNKVDSGDLLTHEQVLYLTKLKTFFKYIENCEAVQKVHLDKYVKENAAYSGSRVYSDFNKMRNNILSLDPAVIDERIKQYCIENRRLYAGKTKNEALILLDKYEVLRNGVWDFLMAANHNQAMKLAELVRNMSRIENEEMYKRNEETLFQKKEPIILSNLLESDSPFNNLTS